MLPRRNFVLGVTTAGRWTCCTLLICSATSRNRRDHHSSAERRYSPSSESRRTPLEGDHCGCKCTTLVERKTLTAEHVREAIWSWQKHPKNPKSKPVSLKDKIVPRQRKLSSPKTCFTFCPSTSFTLRWVATIPESSARRSSRAGFRDQVRGLGCCSRTPASAV